MRITKSLGQQPAAVSVGNEQTSAFPFARAAIAPDASPPHFSTR